VARLSSHISSLIIVLVFVMAQQSSACPDSTHCDSSRINNQLHEGARSLRLLGRTSSSLSVGGKHHFSDHRAVQVSLNLYGSGYWWKERYQNAESSNESVRFGYAIGLQYLHYYNPESTISPFVGCGASFGMSSSKVDYMYSSSDNSRGYEVFYDFDLDIILGFEWQLSEKISLIGEQVLDISYARSKREEESSRTSSQESLQQSVHIHYRILSLGFAFYIR